ncbi:hypothetical protein NL676_008402 [Syzygium grande]|nr:hypothetical protein NL676_008402 [Syzygium grande]
MAGLVGLAGRRSDGATAAKARSWSVGGLGEVGQAGHRVGCWSVVHVLACIRYNDAKVEIGRGRLDKSVGHGSHNQRAAPVREERRRKVYNGCATAAGPDDASKPRPRDEL